MNHHRQAVAAHVDGTRHLIIDRRGLARLAVTRVNVTGLDAVTVGAVIAVIIPFTGRPLDAPVIDAAELCLQAAGVQR